MVKHDEDIEHINLADEEVPHHRPVAAHIHIAHAVDNNEERRKLRRMLIGIFVVGAILTLIRGIEPQRWLADFLAVFSVAFAAIKFADQEAFAHTYRNYDILAKRIRPWGYIVPFIQAFLGFAFLLSEAPVRLDVFALVFSGIACIGAVESYLRDYKVQYAYHKTLLRLPFTRISALENVVTFVLAGALLTLAVIRH